MARPTKRNGAGLPETRKAHVVCGVDMEAVYHVPDLMPKGAGEWRHEADKLAWTDRDTGLPCIIRRDAGGYLWGFVGVPRTHPLFGFDAGAIPRAVIHVHGGLSYSARCDKDGPEELSICHVAGQRTARHDDAWWLGFACNGLFDLVPGVPAHAEKARDLGITQTYRNEPYVFIQCTGLAADLQAVANGDEAPPRRGPAPPPIGLDPGER